MPIPSTFLKVILQKSTQNMRVETQLIRDKFQTNYFSFCSLKEIYATTNLTGAHTYKSKHSLSLGLRQWCQPQSHITTVLLCVCECNCVSVCVCVSEPFLRKRGGQLRSTNMSGWSSEEGSPRPTEVSQCIILLYFFGVNSPAGPSRQVGLSWDRARPGCSSTGGVWQQPADERSGARKTHRPFLCYFRLQRCLLAVHLWQTLTVSQKYVPSYFTAKQLIND